MNALDILSKIYKPLVFIVLTGYLLFLMPYFLTFGIALQFDYNIISVVLIILIIFMSMTFFAFAIAYILDRLLKLTYYKNADIDDIILEQGFDFFFLFISIIFVPIFTITYFFIYELSVIKYVSLAIYISIITSFIVLKIYYEKIYYRAMFLTNIITGAGLLLAFVIYVLKLDILFFVFLTFYLVVFISLINNCSFTKNNKVHSLSLMKYYKEQISKNNIIFLNNINITIFIIVMQILFAIYDFQYNLHSYSNKITSNTLKILNIGAFKGSFLLDSKVAEFISDVTKINSSKQYTQISAHIIWSNDKYLFIQTDSNKTVPIRKEYIPIDIVEVK